MESQQPKRASKQVTEARATAQRAKLDAQDEARQKESEKTSATQQRQSGHQQQQMLAKRRAKATIGQAIADYLLDHEGGNSSDKTLQWHRTALGLLQRFLQEERGISLIGEVDAPDINAWFASMRKTPTSRGKVRSERTIQTYARSARAFFHWLVHREILARNPFDRVAFPKVGKPLIRTIEPEEFEQLLLACTPPGEIGPFADRAAARNRAILWILYDTGIRLDAYEAFLPLTLAIEHYGDAIFNYFTYRSTAGYTESLNGLMKLTQRMGRGYSFEAIRAKALLTNGLQKTSRPGYRGQWHQAAISPHKTSSPDADIANLTACAIARPNGSGTPFPTALIAPETVKLGNSKSSGNP